MYCLCVNVYCITATRCLHINVRYTNYVNIRIFCAFFLEVFPCFFLSYKANTRVKLAKTGHDLHSSKLVITCVVLLLFVLFCVLFVCKCVLYYCHPV